MYATIPINDEHRIFIRFPGAIGEYYTLTKSQTNHIFTARGCLPEPGTVMVDTKMRQYKWVTERNGLQNIHRLQRIK